MSRIIYFTNNGSSGFQLSQEVMDTMQKELQDIIKAFICVVGNNVIVCGVVGPSGGSFYTDGLIIWNNELLYFEGGTFGQYLVIKEETTQLVVCDGEPYDAYTVRTAVFQNTVDPEDEYVEVTDESGLGVFTFTNTITNITNSIADIYNEITNVQTNLETQINNLTTIVNNNSLLDNSEIGDVKYLKDITNFNGNGLGVAGTNREGWALVSTGNNDWKTALGFGGSFNDIDGRTIVIAGTKYSVLNTFGADDITLTGAESGLQGHSHTASTSGTVGGGRALLQTAINDSANPADETRIRVGADGGVTTADLRQQPIETNEHTHPWSGSTTVDAASAQNASSAHENRQPSIALYMAVKYL